MKYPLTKCRNMIGTRNIRVDFLAILFGIGTWIGVNSVYLQLPLLVPKAPEGWSLPSYLVIIIQIANIGPLVYTLIQKYSSKKLNDAYVIYGIYFISCVAAICIAFLHELTAFVAGQERSVSLFIFTFVFALIGCTSSVLFMPYMGRFKEIYLITYLVGEGLSGFLPSILTLIQGIGGIQECIPNASGTGFDAYTPPPRFESRVFFIFIFVLLAISGIAFILLHKLKMCKQEYAIVTIKHGNDYDYDTSKKIDPDGDHTADDDNLENSKSSIEQEEQKKLSPFNYIYLMIIMGAVSMCGSGIFPSVQSYSCLPYGNLAYHLTVTFGSITNPLACFLAVFLPHKSIRHITILTTLMAGITAYALATAVLSPKPPLVGQQIGEALVVSTYNIESRN